jgi:hypothetical protein
MSYCDRINCGYYYKGEDDDFPCCHYPEDDLSPAPCEYDDETETEDDDDYEETEPIEFMSLETGECFTQTEMIADCKANHPDIDPYDGRSIWNYYKELED